MPETVCQTTPKVELSPDQTVRAFIDKFKNSDSYALRGWTPIVEEAEYRAIIRLIGWATISDELLKELAEFAKHVQGDPFDTLNDDYGGMMRDFSSVVKPWRAIERAANCPDLVSD